MRILFLSTWLPYPLDNGSKIRVHYLLRALSSRHPVTLVSFAFGSSIASDYQRLPPGCDAVHVIEKNPFDQNRAPRLVRYMSPTPLFTRPVQAMTQLVQKVLNTHDFDVVIASTEVMSTYAFLSGTSTVKILEEHNSQTRLAWERYTHSSGAYRVIKWLSWLKMRRYESTLFRKFNLVTMVSSQDAQTSKAGLPGYNGRVEIVPNGVDCEHNRPVNGPVIKNSLVFNGSLTYRPNFLAMKYFLAEIYPVLRREVPGITLTITGTTENVDLASLNLDDSVRFSGYVPDIRPYVAGAMVCVVPLLEGGGTRLKILEAMALKTPVVSTTKGAEGLDAGDGVHLLLADDSVAFANAVLQLFQNQSLRDRLAENARMLVLARYDWGQIGGRFLELVEEVPVKKAGRQTSRAASS